MLAQINFRVLEVYLVAALWYLVLVSIWGLIQTRIEAHYEKPFGPAAAISPDAEKELKKALQQAGTAKI
jgi:polar amino acid transport system permease protein